jgi:hypothetical protein
MTGLNAMLTSNPPKNASREVVGLGVTSDQLPAARKTVFRRIGIRGK